jgi:uncharacterized membrane protein
MRRPTRPRGDDGTILLLSIGFCAIALLLVWAVVDASAVFLARRDLAAAVDGTALAAAQQIDTQGVYESGASDDLPLSAAAVRDAVDGYVSRTYPANENVGQQITGEVTPDQHAVAVTGRRILHLPGFGTITVTARATAVSHTRR